jgi:hypothetical protein
MSNGKHAREAALKRHKKRKTEAHNKPSKRLQSGLKSPSKRERTPNEPREIAIEQAIVAR